jgi:hypothetical protein
VSFADPFALGAFFGPVRAHDREVVPRAPPEKTHPSLGLDESHPAFSCVGLTARSHELFLDESFADLFMEVGRNSVPPRIAVLSDAA